MLLMGNAHDLPEKAAEEGQRPESMAGTPSDHIERGALLALLRLLMREPPPGHDFKTCPICKRYGITEI
jgi:hypothetical protein